MGAVSVEEDWRVERRVRILEAAARVFARLTYRQASMDEIAAEAGFGKPTLYRYFPGKDALFAAVFVHALDELERRLSAILACERGIERQLGAIVRAMIPTFRDHLVALRFLGDDAAAIDRSQRRIFRERRVRIAAFVSDALDRGVAAGEIERPVDPGRVAHLVIGMIWSGTSSLAGTDDELASEIAGLVLHGICRGGLDEAAAVPGGLRSDERHSRHDPTPPAIRRRLIEAAN